MPVHPVDAMTQELTQWIAEVRTLQCQLADTRKERDQAYNSAANWRRLYENEAHQRRQESEQFQAQLAELQRHIQQAAADQLAHQQNLATVNSLPGFQQQLDTLVAECQRLTQALEAERKAHAQTRQSLTSALGDTFDLIKAASPASLVQ